MKKIIFLINTLGTGGAEHVLVDIVNKLDSNKFDVTIKTIYNDYFFADKLNKNIKLESFYKRKKNVFIEKVFNKIVFLMMNNLSTKKLYKKIVSKKYDIEVSFLEGLPTKIISGSNSNAKKIAWVHTSMNNNRESDIFFKDDKQQKECYQKFDEIYCVSKDCMQSFYDRFKIKKNVYVIYNIINYNEIIQKSNEKIEDLVFEKCFNIVTVGRLTKQKANVRLIESYNDFLKNSKIKTHLYIIGEGLERKHIEDKINELGVNSFVTLTGNKTNPYKYMKHANLYLCSSYAEGYSLVIMEALTLKIPYLTTDCGGITKELTKNSKFGLTVENSKEGITKGLLEIVNNRNLLDNYKSNIEKNYKYDENEIKKIENRLLK